MFLIHTTTCATPNRRYNFLCFSSLAKPWIIKRRSGLIDEGAVSDYENALLAARLQGGTVLYGGKIIDPPPFGRRIFVLPTIVEIRNDAAITQSETFAPILYVMKYRSIDEAIALHNAVPQGLSSGILRIAWRRRRDS